MKAILSARSPRRRSALPDPSQARSLDTIRSIGALGLCAHPNSLPFASKTDDPPGFQVEMGRALAHELGVSLKLDWIITQFQMRSADCDILMDIDRRSRGARRNQSQDYRSPIIARASRLPCLRQRAHVVQGASTSTPRSGCKSAPWRR